LVGTALHFLVGIHNWFGRLVRMGFRPLLTESDGQGGYHLRGLFRSPVPCPWLYAFLCSFVSDYSSVGLAAAPDVFPAQAGVTPTRPYGNWVRLPGMHHKTGLRSRVWDPDGGRWLAGNNAIDALVSLDGDDPALLPAQAPAAPGGHRPAGEKAAPGRAPRVLPQLIGQERNINLNSLAGTCRRRGLDAVEILPLLVVVNARRCQPPLEAAEVEGIAYGIERYPPGEVPGALLYPGRPAGQPQKILHCEFQVTL
jgi:hypothetical protein